ncbi:D-alanyl-D-alanine carboxypeptidase family protein [Agromyces albus]|uniref:D-alanyl-D-alanine carboxypeptidase family protein n=1 Tax=Agromyces albus TaxID=205332 RepID=UPI00278A378C|nr:D-alanyl-D-alanine carboxypeptidase [Agromyces albus]MDQ0575382.1 D-alanyl-D-alanine carboxypeptidase (penicillin-binding protein 5/6) [Agromyces albus]
MSPQLPTLERERRPDRTTTYRRRRIVVFGSLAVVLALLLTGGMYAGNTLGAPIPAAQPAVSAPEPIVAAAQPLALPSFGGYAVGAVGFDGLLAASPDQSLMPIASITKIVTALLILEAKPLAPGEEGPGIEYTEADVDLYWQVVAENGSVAPVSAGTTLSERQSLAAMLLASGNNYAISLATWAYGSMEAFLDAAQGWLDEHGLENTRLVDSSGISLDNVSTPAELVELGEIALADPTVSELVATQSMDLPVIGTVKNSNKLLGTHGVDGIKTGTTDDAANLLFSADYPVGSQVVTVVGVVLGGENHTVLDEAIAALLDSIAPGFQEVTALEAGQELASYSTAWGDTARARAVEGASVVIWSDTPVDVEVVAAPVTVAASGAEVGTATVRAGTQEIVVALELDAAIEDPGAWWRLSNPGALEAGAQSPRE